MDENIMNISEMPPLNELDTEGPPLGWKPPMADISWVKRKYLDVAYDIESKNQCMDIYLPDEGEGPFPVLLHIHGGGFAIGDKRDNHMDAYLTAIKRGMAAVSIEYRLSGEAIFPAAVLDVRNAVRFLRRNGKEYMLDSERITAIGGSAGGNLAAMLGMNIPNGRFVGEKRAEHYQATPYVKLAIDQFGPMNFASMDEQAQKNGFSKVEHDEPFSPESKYIGTAIQDADPKLVSLTNPANYISGNMCRMLVQHGTCDKLVPYEQSVEFVERIEAELGNEYVTFIPMEGADHEDKKFFSEENMNLIFKFINENIG